METKELFVVIVVLNNEEIRGVIDTVAQKGVLILGRFTPERKKILDAVREKLRSLGYVPMMFDFEKVTSRDFTETIKTLASMSRFVIADITNPSSSRKKRITNLLLMLTGRPNESTKFTQTVWYSKTLEQ